MAHKSNEALRHLKFVHRLTSKDVWALLASDTGGPSLPAVKSWSGQATSYNKMPGNSLDLLIIRLKEAGYKEVTK